MDWSSTTWWWLATGVLVVAELATGTFYLLMLALGAAAAALAAHAGLSVSLQLTIGALVGGGATAGWYLRRKRSREGSMPGRDRNLNLDIGERVQVTHWEPGGNTRVNYRGAAWSARYGGTDDARPGAHVIREIDGARLILVRATD